MLLLFALRSLVNRWFTRLRLLGQAVKTSPFHGGNTGSIPVGVIVLRKRVSRVNLPKHIQLYNYIWRHSQVVRQRSATPLSPVQIWLAPLKNPRNFQSFLDFLLHVKILRQRIISAMFR